MIRELQRKFIVTAMMAVSVLLLILLGTINVLNIFYVDNQIEKKLEIISQNEGDPHNIPIPPENPPQRGPGMKNEYDTVMSSNFFVVHFDKNGDVVYLDKSRVSSVSEEESKILAKKAYNRDKQTGKINNFEYMIRDSRLGIGKVIIFLDTSSDIYSCIRVLILSFAIGAVCWILMFLLIVFLSKRAIRPIAENMERQKQFVTNAGHEIKTPISIIQANTEAMELYNGENKWSKNIKEQTIRLNELTKRLLDLARMNESNGKVVFTDCSLSQLLIESINCYKNVVELRSITLKTAIQPRVSFRANKEHIKELVSVLMDNAVKYTNNNGNIIISLEKKDKRIELQFKNTCDELPPVSPNKLFDRFYRVDEARTQRDGGYGIGLSVAQSIVEIYKGKILAEYEKGNIISFTIIL